MSVSSLSDVEAINKFLKNNPQMIKELFVNNPTFKESIEKLKLECKESIEKSIRKIKATNKMDYSPMQLDYIKTLPNSNDFVESLDIQNNVKYDINRMISRLNEEDIGSLYNPMMFAILQGNQDYINITKRSEKGRIMIELLSK
jgi:hypothetical protein